jgi:hypothetical protein
LKGSGDERDGDGFAGALASVDRKIDLGVLLWI